MYILAIDQGTTGTTTVLYDQDGKIVDKAYREFTQIYPKPGWVEHDPLEIWGTVKDSVQELKSRNKEKIAGIGITNQRETTIIWDKNTGLPIHNAIVWQCRRTADICDQLKPKLACLSMPISAGPRSSGCWKMSRDITSITCCLVLSTPGSSGN